VYWLSIGVHVVGVATLVGAARAWRRAEHDLALWQVSDRRHERAWAATLFTLGVWMVSGSGALWAVAAT
jgi:hypothetical protein